MLSPHPIMAFEVMEILMAKAVEIPTGICYKQSLIDISAMTEHIASPALSVTMIFPLCKQEGNLLQDLPKYCEVHPICQL
jgi:hypothetical protein